MPRFDSAVVDAGEAFLLRSQSAEGQWRDFALEPGASEAWTTACVGWVLARPAARGSTQRALHNAACSLHASIRRNGWGYNVATAIDADTTAWVLRFLAAIDDLRTLDAAACLLPFVDANGAARTFACADRFGRWGEQHADVTPLVGLALLEAGRASQAAPIRAACLAGFDARVPWRSFWWNTDAYAIARNLEFLAVSGGIPPDVLGGCRTWLGHRSAPSSVFECAQLAIVARLVDASDARAQFVAALVSAQHADGGWSASHALLVPSQRVAPREAGARAHEDVRRLMTTAMATLALKGELHTVA
jgi:hypothetical protein